MLMVEVTGDVLLVGTGDRVLERLCSRAVVKMPDREDYDQVLEVDEGAICYN